MKTTQISPSPTRPPCIIPGASKGGLEAGVFDIMKTPETPLVGTLDYYRKLAETNPDIAALVGLIDRQGLQLVKALEALALEHAKRMAAAKILTSDAA